MRGPGIRRRRSIGAALPLALSAALLLPASLLVAGCAPDDAAEAAKAVGEVAQSRSAGAAESSARPDRAAERRFWAEFRAATAARGAGHRARAIRDYEAALESRPEHGDSRYYAAQLRYARGEVDLAVHHLRRLAEIEPRGLRAWQQLSSVHGTPRPGWAPDLEAAAAAAREAIRLKPSESLSHLLLARWAAYAGDRHTAMAELHLALGYNPDLEAGHRLRDWLRDAPEGRARGIDGLDRVRRTASRGSDLRLGEGAGLVEALELPFGAVLLTRKAAGAARALPDPLPVTGWTGDSDAGSEPGPAPVPWRAVRIRGRGGPEIWVAGGGARQLRSYLRRGQAGWEESPASLPRRLPGAVLAPLDLDGDGRDEVFVANLLAPGPWVEEPPEDADLFGVVLGADDSGRWVPRSRPVAGPWSAAASVDLDGDGDPDLVVARDVERAGISLPFADEDEAKAAEARPPAGAGTAEESVIVAFRNDDGRLRPAPGILPTLTGLTVRDLRALSVGGRRALYLATGGLAPESGGHDRLWVRSDAGDWIDGSDRLGPGGAAGTLRAIPLGAGQLLLRRGGLVPADPPTWKVLNLE